MRTPGPTGAPAWAEGCKRADPRRRTGWRSSPHSLTLTPTLTLTITLTLTLTQVRCVNATRGSTKALALTLTLTLPLARYLYDSTLYKPTTEGWLGFELSRTPPPLEEHLPTLELALASLLGQGNAHQP